MRAALAVCLLFAVGCTNPSLGSASASPSSRPSSSQLATGASGGVIEYALPDPQTAGSSCSDCGHASASRITAGSDGNIWFTDSGNRKVGRITPSGAVTEFELPDAGGIAFGIAVGPDKNIWITVTAVGQGRPDWIARIDSSGEVTKFPAGTGSGSYPGTSAARRDRPSDAQRSDNHLRSPQGQHNARSGDRPGWEYLVHRLGSQRGGANQHHGSDP